MEGLRIEFSGESLDLLGIELMRRTFEALPNAKVFEVKFPHASASIAEPNGRK
jgi:hypothetical protein